MRSRKGRQFVLVADSGEGKAPNDAKGWDEVFAELEARGYRIDRFWDEEYSRALMRTVSDDTDLYVVIECEGEKPEPHALIIEAFEADPKVGAESWEGHIRIDFESCGALLRALRTGLDDIERRVMAAALAARPEWYGKEPPS